MKKISKLVMFVLCLGLILSMTVAPAYAAVSSIKLNKTSITLNVDRSYRLTATVSPSGETDTGIMWSSSNNNVARVDGFGLVKPAAKGTATITATSANGKKAACKVTVKAYATPKLTYKKLNVGKIEYLYDYSEGIAMVETSGKIGYVNSAGKVVAKTAYVDGKAFSDGMAAVLVGDKWGFIDTNGKLVISAKYDQVNSFREGLAAVNQNGKWGFIDKKGKFKIKLTYDGVAEDEGFVDGIAAVRSGSKWSFINRSGKVLKTFSLDALYPFYEGVAKFEKKGTYGFMDKNYKTVVDNLTTASNFSEGMAVVGVGDSMDNAQYGYINTSGETVIPIDWMLASNFSNGYASVSSDKSFAFIDKSGKVKKTLSNTQFSGGFTDGVASIGKFAFTPAFGFMDKNGKTLLNYTFNAVTDFEAGTSMGLVKNQLYLIKIA